MVWTELSALTMGASALAATMTAIYLKRRSRAQRTSSLCWLFTIFFSYLAVWCAARCAYMAWFWAMATRTNGMSDEAADQNFNDFDRLSLEAVAWLRIRRAVTMSVVMCVGDAALCGVVVCTFSIVRELWLLTRNAMDAGSTKETAKVRWYALAIHGLVLCFAVMDVVFVAQDHTYSKRMVEAKLFVYLLQSLGVVVIAVVLLRVKCIGRKFEPVHGVFVESPLYCRLRRIMLIYAFCSCQFQLASLVLTWSPHTDVSWLGMMSGISLIMFSGTGLVLSITMGCSQVCVLHACVCIVPSDVEAAWLPPLATQAIQHVHAPTDKPVFVCTDIESSSALWGLSSSLMQHATEIHDNVLRASLTKFHGYEITTAGDAFHLAFPTVAQALGYCFEVQQALLVAAWPKELHGLVPATETIRRSYRLLFRGLRVRMGIHDAHPQEGPLVCSQHAVTGKTTYTGAADIIVNEVCDLAAGGQILVTQRIAEWIEHHPASLPSRCMVDAVGQFGIPQLHSTCNIFQVHPQRLQGRTSYFSPTLRRTMASPSQPVQASADNLPRSSTYSRLESARAQLTADTAFDATAE